MNTKIVGIYIAFVIRMMYCKNEDRLSAYQHVKCKFYYQYIKYSLSYFKNRIYKRKPPDVFLVRNVYALCKLHLSYFLNTSVSWKQVKIKLSKVYSTFICKTVDCLLSVLFAAIREYVTEDQDSSSQFSFRISSPTRTVLTRERSSSTH